MRPRDVEGDLITLLGTTAVPVSTLVPNPRPAKFIRVSRAGGDRRNLIQEQPLVIVECWADTSVGAFTIAQDAWSEIDAEYGDDAGLTSPVWFPDPDTAQARYQFTVNLFASLEVS